MSCSCCGIQFGQLGAAGGGLAGLNLGACTGAGEDVEAEVAAAFADSSCCSASTAPTSSDHRVAVRSDRTIPTSGSTARSAGARSPWGSRCTRARRHGRIEVVGHIGQLVDQAVEDPVALGVHGFGVGLVLDAVQWRLDPAQLAFG